MVFFVGSVLLMAKASAVATFPHFKPGYYWLAATAFWVCVCYIVNHVFRWYWKEWEKNNRKSEKEDETKLITNFANLWPYISWPIVYHIVFVVACWFNTANSRIMKHFVPIDVGCRFSIVVVQFIYKCVYVFGTPYQN